MGASRKLTKTQTALLERAKTSRHRQATVRHGFRTGRKNSNYGSRECAALGELVRMGMVRILSQRSYVDAHCWYSDHWTETIFELVEQGKPLIEIL